MELFKLRKKFVNSYKDRVPPFGFNGLGELIYKRTYARLKEDGTQEDWYETVERVVNGCYQAQQHYIEKNGLGWSAAKAQLSAEEMYDRVFYMKFLPPGRGLFVMGTPYVKERGGAALNNCAFVSTKDMDVNPIAPFIFLMDMSMLGVGVGFDVRGKSLVDITAPDYDHMEDFVIEDSREGWVHSVERLLESFFFGDPFPKFDYTKIRPKGADIRGFGGTASGYAPLKKLHSDIVNTLVPLIDQPVTATAIVDIMNQIGCCVVAGNVRRTAEIVLGPNLDEYLDLKNYVVNPHRAAFGWASNNSLLAKVGQNYKECSERTALNGEPGYFWLENAQKYSRVREDELDWRDKRADGTNPCSEQTLESYELCCLVETFPENADNLQDYLRTLKFAYLYAKSVTLIKTHWSATNRVMLRNRRIGTSITGVVQYIAHKGIDQFKTLMEEGYKVIQHYDKIYSDWLCIPESIKKTSIKPSGSVSLLAGATPGVHYPISRYYIRRVILAKNSELVPKLKNAGYTIENKEHQEDTSVVVEFPVDAGAGVRAEHEVSMWEQLALVALIQKYWADNQVSCTVTFNPKTEGHQIEKALDYYQYQLKSVSFLPRLESGAYNQMPYEAITKEEYDNIIKKLKPLSLSNTKSQGIGEKFCDNDTCVL